MLRVIFSAFVVVGLLFASGCAGTQRYELGFMGATAAYTYTGDGKVIVHQATRGLNDPCGTQRVVLRAPVEVKVRAVDSCGSKAVTCGSKSTTKIATQKEMQRSIEHNYKVDTDQTDQRSMWSALIGKFGVHRKYHSVVVAE